MTEDAYIQWQRERDDQVNEILERCTYRPGTTFKIQHGAFLANLMMPDACSGESGDRLFPWTGDWTDVYEVSDEDLERWVLKKLCWEMVFNEMHEVGEWLRIDGHQPFDPHTTNHEMHLKFEAPEPWDFRYEEDDPRHTIIR